MSQAQPVSRQVVLPAFYRTAMRLTRRRGSHTLGRLNASLFPRGQLIGLETGCDFFLPPDPHFFGYLLGHEAHITRVIADIVEEGDVCVDVGANIGYFSLMMAAKCGPSGRVFAYEPDHANFAMLTQNVQIARQQGFSIAPIEAAVSDCNGVVELLKGKESTLHQVRAVKEGAPGVKVVKCLTLTDDLSQRTIEQPIKLLKIDVEGHEPAVLRGYVAALRAGHVQVAVIEINEGHHAREVADILNSLDATVQCWIDGAWKERPLTEIPYRTDILVRF